MIRLGRYHIIAALGLVLAYQAIAGMLDSLAPREATPFERPDGLSVAAPWEPAPEGAAPGESPGAPAAVEPTLDEPQTQDPPAVIIDITPPSSAAPPIPAESGALQTEMPIIAGTGGQPPVASQAEPDAVPPADPQVEGAGVEPAANPEQTAPPAAPATLEALAEAPMRLVIPDIGLDTPIVSAKARTLEFRGESFQQWLAPAFFAAGWHSGSALLGSPGNTVLNGHHNIHGEVFGRLVDLEIGDRIQVYSDRHLFIYQITNRMIVPEKYQEMDTRMANAQWILPSQDERLTLITCWPDETNTHRVIIVAVPIERRALDQ